MINTGPPNSILLMTLNKRKMKNNQWPMDTHLAISRKLFETNKPKSGEDKNSLLMPHHLQNCTGHQAP